MYRCFRCKVVSKPKEPMRTHRVLRNVAGRVQIAAELPVCESCSRKLVEDSRPLVLGRSATN